MNEAAVAEAIDARRGVDACDPQASEVTPAIATIAIGIKERLEHGFIGTAKKAVPGTKLALGKFKNFFVPFMGIDLRSRAWHSCFFLSVMAKLVSTSLL